MYESCLVDDGRAKASCNTREAVGLHRVAQTDATLDNQPPPHTDTPSKQSMDPDSILSHVAFTTSGSLVDCIDS